MAYQRKTSDEYQIHQWWNGWEEVHAESTRREALARLREYRENQPGVAVKIVKRRVPRTTAEMLARRGVTGNTSVYR